jgi:hypothetical protein
MATKNKSSGSQHNSRGVTQGVSLVDPKTGLPVDVVEIAGKKRLAVDANITATIGDVSVDLDVDEDGVHIGDKNTGATLTVEADGSLNANVEIDAADGDNIAIKDSAGHELDINPDGSVNTKDAAVLTETQSINSKLSDLLTELEQKTEPTDTQNIAAASLPLPTGAATETTLATLNNKIPPQGPALAAQSIPVTIATNQTAIPVDLEAFTSTPDNVFIVGTEDGTKTGVKRGYVNNLRQQILASHDRIQNITYADFGTKDERVTSITYTSPTFPSATATKTITYTQVGTKYRRDAITWSIT